MSEVIVQDLSRKTYMNSDYLRFVKASAMVQVCPIFRVLFSTSSTRWCSVVLSSDRARRHSTLMQEQPTSHRIPCRLWHLMPIVLFTIVRHPFLRPWPTKQRVKYGFIVLKRSMLRSDVRLTFSSRDLQSLATLSYSYCL